MIAAIHFPGVTMKSRFILLFVLLFCFLLNRPLLAQEARPAENLSQLIDTAIAHNPELKASDARWQMFRNRIAQARTFDDPMLMLKIQNGIFTDPFNFRKDPMTQKVIGISQQLPFWGKRDLKGEVAAKEAESYRWQVEERRLELRRMVAETKYSVGQGAQQDVFKAQVERSKLLDMRISLEQQRKSLQASLNALLYRPAETTVGAIPDVDIKPLMQSPEA